MKLALFQNTPIAKAKYHIIYFFTFAVIFIRAQTAAAQTYVFAQLQGAPVNTTGWSFSGNAHVANVKSTNNSEILLASTDYYQSGAIFYDQPINLLRCNKWTAEFDFRIYDGTGADGIAFCFLDVPPSGYVSGGGLGIPGSANGLKVCFDPYPNCAPDTVPRIEIRWGEGYDECWLQPTLSNINGITSFVRSDTYNHAKIVYDDGNISVYVNNQLYLTGYQQFTFAGYMGFTASTGGSYDNHSIKNVVIYTNEPPSNAGGDKQMCSGTTVQLGTTPNANYTYSWVPGDGLSANNIANPTLTLTNTTGSAVTTTYSVYTSLKSTSSCQSVDAAQITVEPTPVVTVNALATSVCAGTPITFTATTSSTPANYLWYKNNASTGITTATYTGMFQDKDQVTCSSISATCTAMSATVAISVTPYQKPSVSITTSAGTICPGTAVTFTATPINGGTAPVYQWKINGNNAGANSSTYSTSLLNNNDVVTCGLTSNGFCIAPASVTSNALTTTVIPAQQPQATLAYSAATNCEGTAITFTMKVSSGSATAYQWMVNGTNVSTDSVYITSTLHDQDKVSCNVTANTTCTTGIPLTQSIVMQLVKNPVPSVSITASGNNICPGTAVTFKATPVNGGTTPGYQWLLNGADAGTNLNIFTTSALNNNDVVSCRLTSNVSCVLPATVTSNSITMSVTPAQQPIATLTTSANNICAGTAVNFTMQVSDGSATAYQWKVNGVNVSTDSVYSSATLNNQDKVSCVVTARTTCTTGISLPGSLVMNVTNMVTASVNITASDNGVCPGVPVTFTAIPANAGTNVNYLWMVNNVNAGTNSDIFTSSTLADNDVVTCQVTPQNVACLTQPTTLSNEITVVILPLPVITLPANQTITAGDDINLSPVITGSIAQYTWEPTTHLSDPSIQDPVASPIYNTIYTLTAVSTGGCAAITTTDIKVLRKKIKVNNTFTPNGDNINDTWDIPDLQNYTACVVDVYNRYGTPVFHSIGYLQPWDGKYNNRLVPPGVYYYVINLKDGSVPVGGEVTVIR